MPHRLLNAMIHTTPTAALRTVTPMRAVTSVRPVTTVPDTGVQLATTTIPALQESGLAPLVMLHGVLASSNTYNSLLKRKDFAPRRDKIALDLRNHGRSPHAQGMEYEEMADDVSGTLRELGVRQAVLCGHSMGGKVAMTMALSQPRMAAALIAVDIAPVTYKPALDPEGTSPATALRAMRAVDVEHAESRAQVDRALADNGVHNADVRTFIGTNLAPLRPSGFRWKCNVDEIQYALRDITSFPQLGESTYVGPTMIVRGGQSNYVPFTAMKDTTRLFPDTKLVTVNDAGHWLLAQRPDAFVEAVNEFLDEVDL